MLEADMQSGVRASSSTDCFTSGIAIGFLFASSPHCTGEMTRRNWFSGTQKSTALASSVLQRPRTIEDRA